MCFGQTLRVYPKHIEKGAVDFTSKCRENEITLTFK